MAYLLRTGDEVEVVHDRHLQGVFPRSVWIGLLEAAGFAPVALPFRHSEFGPGEEIEMFVGVRPAG
jgi:hypothetical protein